MMIIQIFMSDKQNMYYLDLLLLRFHVAQHMTQLLICNLIAIKNDVL